MKNEKETNSSQAKKGRAGTKRQQASKAKKEAYRREGKTQKGEKIIIAPRVKVPKYADIGPLSQAKISGIDRHWKRRGYILAFLDFRAGEGAPKIPDSFAYYDHDYLMSKFNLSGWQFGNWVNQEMRLNYVCAVGLCLLDLKHLLGLPYSDIGLRGLLGISIGARGRGGKYAALAHFEPWSWIINMTRYSDTGNTLGLYKEASSKNPKLMSFLKTGGVGAFSHEYGHALDYWLGTYFDRSSSHVALSRGNSTASKPDPKLVGSRSLRGYTERLMQAIIFNDDQSDKSDYRKRLSKIDREYWIRRNEIFARAFEQYISWKMYKKRFANSYLAQEKYVGPKKGSYNLVYMKDAEIERVAPYFEEWLGAVKKALK